MFRLIILIDGILSIPKLKFVDPVIVLLSLTEKTFYRAINCLILLIDLVTILESINSSLNLQSLYYKLVDLVKL